MDPLGHRPVPSPAEVERQLAEFWREASTEEQVVMRACSMNLVVVCDRRDDDLARATRRVAEVSRTLPCRALVVGPPGANGEELAVFVSAHCHRGAGGAQVCSEQVTLEAGAAALSLVPASVLQLLVEDMPVYVWWRRPELDDPSLAAPLIELSDYLVLDSAAVSRPAEHLGQLLALPTHDGWRGHVVDLAWARLEPLREAVASLFDDPGRRPALGRLTRIEVCGGGPVACAYVVGWFCSRLGLVPEGSGRLRRADGERVLAEVHVDARCEPGEIAAVGIRADGDSGPLVFDARLAQGRHDCLLLDVGGDGPRRPTHRVTLPQADEGRLLCGALQRYGRDPVFESSLAAAVATVDTSGTA